MKSTFPLLAPIAGTDSAKESYFIAKIKLAVYRQVTSKYNPPPRAAVLARANFSLRRVALLVTSNEDKHVTNARYYGHADNDGTLEGSGILQYAKTPISPPVMLASVVKPFVFIGWRIGFFAPALVVGDFLLVGLFPYHSMTGNQCKSFRQQLTRKLTLPYAQPFTEVQPPC